MGSRKLWTIVPDDFGVIFNYGLIVENRAPYALEESKLYKE